MRSIERMLFPSASALITAVCFSVDRLFAIFQSFFLLDLLCHINYLRQDFFVLHKRKTLGRPTLPKGEAKTEMVRARVTPSELRAMEKAANGNGISEWARGILQRHIKH